jgi:hypothetical protein
LNNNVATPRPTFPNPGALDPAANPAAREIHKTALTAFLHGDHFTALAEIKADMLASIGEANREHMRDPIVGMHNHTCNSIIAAMALLHGQCTEADVLRFTDDLQKKLSDLENFDSHVGKFAATLRQLVQAGTHSRPRTRSLQPFQSNVVLLPRFRKAHRRLCHREPGSRCPYPQRPCHLPCVRLHLASVKAKSGRNPFAGSAQQEKLTKKVAALERQTAALSAAHPPHQVRNAQVHPPPTTPGRRTPVTSLTLRRCLVSFTFTIMVTTAHMVGPTARVTSMPVGTWRRPTMPLDSRLQ